MCTILQSSLDIVEKGLIDFIKINSVPLQYAVPEFLYFDHPVYIYSRYTCTRDIRYIYYTCKYYGYVSVLSNLTLKAQIFLKLPLILSSNIHNYTTEFAFLF